MPRVYYEESGKSEPRPHEKRAAILIMEYFESDIIFIRRRSSKTPDLYIVKSGICWELKSPEGGSKHTVQNNLRNIDSQSENVILDFSRIRLTDSQGISRTKEFLRKEHFRIKRLKIILKNQEILTLLDK